MFLSFDYLLEKSIPLIAFLKGGVFNVLNISLFCLTVASVEQIRLLSLFHTFRYKCGIYFVEIMLYTYGLHGFGEMAQFYQFK